MTIYHWRSQYFLKYLLKLYLNYYLSHDVCVCFRLSVCLSVFLQIFFFVQNGSNSQIWWTDISNSRIQARRAWSLYSMYFISELKCDLKKIDFHMIPTYVLKSNEVHATRCLMLRYVFYSKILFLNSLRGNDTFSLLENNYCL
mgnify:CR=1 FL=1